MDIKVCPQCGKNNLENAWNCVDCGRTLSLNTLVDAEGCKKSDRIIAGYSELSKISPYFQEDIVEHLDTIIGTDKPVFGCNVTQIAKKEPFLFGYLVITSQRIVHVQFESEVQRACTSWFWIPLYFLALLASYLIIMIPIMRPKRPWIDDIPAINYPSYPLVPAEKDSRRVKHDYLKNLMGADLVTRWHGDMHLISLDLKFHENKEMCMTFYTPHEAKEAYEILSVRAAVLN